MSRRFQQPKTPRGGHFQGPFRLTANWCPAESAFHPERPESVCSNFSITQNWDVREHTLRTEVQGFVNLYS